MKCLYCQTPLKESHTPPLMVCLKCGSEWIVDTNGFDGGQRIEPYNPQGIQCNSMEQTSPHPTQKP
jgi:hypothetical protein